MIKAPHEIPKGLESQAPVELPRITVSDQKHPPYRQHRHNLGGTRLSKFMESVDAVTRTSSAEAPPAPVPEAFSGRRRTQPGSTVESDADAPASRPSNTSAPAVEPQVAAATLETTAGLPASDRLTGEPAAAKLGAILEPAQNPWAPLLQVGLQLAQVLSAASNRSTSAAPTSGAIPSWVEKDARTGRQYLRLPLLPDPEAVQELAAALSRLMDATTR